jgi:riboflavin kinase/FMN adenylyltransferase
MDIIHKKFKSESLDGDWVITIGNFDGYHVGHQALANQVLQDKERLNAKGGIITFEPHPKEVLQPNIPFYHIYCRERKYDFFEELGLDSLFEVPFTRNFAKMDSQDFVERLFNLANIRKIIVGYDFNFGKSREGSAGLLEKEAHKRGCEFQQVGPVKVNGITVSSTMIRRLLFEGDFEMAGKFLGRSWKICGEVREGNKLGHTIGFPTINVEPSVLLPLKSGVFACQVEIEGNRYNGVANVGYRPTFQDTIFKAEMHIFDFNQDVYGKWVQIIPLKFMREEQKFSSVEELRQQIEIDVKEVRNFFSP